MNKSLKAFLLTCLIFLSPGIIQAASQSLNSIKIIKFRNYTRAILIMDRKFHYNVFTLSAPNRVVIDLEKTRLKVNIKKLAPANSEIRSVRSGYSKNLTLRIVFDTVNSTRISSQVVSDANQSKLVVDIYPTYQFKNIKVPAVVTSKKIILSTEATKELPPRNEFGFLINEPYVSDLETFWNYSSVYYYRLTDAGKFGGHVNYAARYDTSAEQYQLEAYPKFSKNVYATLIGGYAKPTQILWPSYYYYMEGYVDVSHGLEFSLGQSGRKFLRFSNQKIFDYTGTLGKYIGNSFVWFRPHHFTPKNTEFFEVGYRKYFDDPDNYVGIIISEGKLPDIGDVPPLDQMIVITQQGVVISGQYKLAKTLFLKYGAGYAKQRFPSNLTRTITDGSLGLTWKI